ncbi:beta-1,3-galactosyltransferase 2-like isoform X2 [Grus americana]|nr:beta-1,3-galactosyltransferase 2-like isoform X2 [Grus americana]XP_054663908.1 beta-1,3-galactosyltransferase 2-like isoform X2 [Grus americana]
MKCQVSPRLLLLPVLAALALLGLRVQRFAEEPVTTAPLLPGPDRDAVDPRHRPAAAFQWHGAPDSRGNVTVKPAPTRHPLQPPYPYPYRFLLNEPHKCRERTPFLVLLVVTEPGDMAGRNVIRQTWGNESSVPGVAILRLFLLGVHPVFGQELRAVLEEESLLYHDLLQQDFLDTYNNLTLKTLMGMEWVSKHCPNASYVMKADRDVFLNLGYLVRRFLVPPKKNFMTGYIYRNTGPLRSKAYKWYVPPEVYPNTTYPPYCGGPGYVFSGDLAGKIYAVAQTLPVINMEDSFVGICLHALGVSVTGSPWGVFNMYRLEYEKCRFSRLVMVHHYQPQDLLKVWPHFQKANVTCQS